MNTTGHSWYVCSASSSWLTHPIDLDSSPSLQTTLGLSFSNRERLLSPEALLGRIPQHRVCHVGAVDGHIVVVAVEGVHPMVLHFSPTVADVSGRDVLDMVFRGLTEIPGVCAAHGLKGLSLDTIDKFSARNVLVRNAIEGDVHSGAVISLDDLVTFDEDNVAVVTTCLLDEVPNCFV